MVGQEPLKLSIQVRILVLEQKNNNVQLFGSNNHKEEQKMSSVAKEIQGSKNIFSETASVLREYAEILRELGKKKVGGKTVKGLRGQIYWLCARLNFVAKNIEEVGTVINDTTQKRFKDIVLHNNGMRKDILKAQNRADAVITCTRDKRPDISDVALELGDYIKSILYKRSI